ncbi:metallophosphoesterase family protein [Ornithinimicrobium murale]|uniref:metallophosphoesterase family protein n=1 Tax=Ornithinimicrobium murale TaxID=1050153 RepID=UPI000E0E0214|nr:metallophosphoesterase [Ornithinimicrobium murale]
MPDLQIIHTGDSHIDTVTHGGVNPATGLDRALEANLAAVASGVAHALEHQVAAYVHCGDAFTHGRPSMESVLLLAETLLPLVNEGIALVLIDGNHERLRVPTNQRTATSVLAALLAPHGEVHVVEREPSLVTTSTGVQVAGLPWLSKATVLTELGKTDVDPVAGDRIVVSESLRWLDEMCASADGSMPLILASHVTVDDVKIDSLATGARRGSELDITHVFAEPILPRAALEDSPVAYAALSHIHARQHLGGKCYYSGSPNRLTLTDADDPKSVNLVTLGPGNTLVSVEHLATDARAMHSIDLAAKDAGARLASLNLGALVGLRLPAGQTQVPGDVLEALTSAGARLVDTKIAPAEVTQSETVVVAERTDPVTALSTWLSTHRPDTDAAKVTQLAGELVEAVSA